MCTFEDILLVKGSHESESKKIFIKKHYIVYIVPLAYNSYSFSYGYDSLFRIPY